MGIDSPIPGSGSTSASEGFPAHLIDQFWDAVRTPLRERFGPPTADEAIRTRREELRSKGAEHWIYHREPSEVAESLANDIEFRRGIDRRRYA